MSAANELAERGFEVELYERNSLGGKARGYRIPDTGTGGRADLPGEIGPHVPFGIYATLPRILQRIPAGRNGSVWDNFAVLPHGRLIWAGGAATLPMTTRGIGQYFAPTALRKIIPVLARVLRRLPLIDALKLAVKLASLLASGEKRQCGELEYLTIHEYLRADELSYEAQLLTRFITAAGIGHSTRMSARLLARTMIGFADVALRRSGIGDLVRICTGPYDEAVFEPWGRHLENLGVRIHLGATLTDFNHDGQRITGASVSTITDERTTVDADWYVLAIPPDRAAQVLDIDLCAADPMLARISHIETTWLGGISIYFNKPMPELRKLQLCASQPWSMALCSYLDIWPPGFSDRYGDGTVWDYLSIDIPDWDIPGVLYGKPAKELAPQQIFTEVLTQLRRELPNGEQLLPDAVIHSWQLSPSFTVNDDGVIQNDEPLFVNTPGSFGSQPTTITAIDNLFLAGSYLRTNAGLGLDSMDSAAESGCQASNAILRASGSGMPLTPIARFETPWYLKPFAAIDDFFYTRARPEAGHGDSREVGTKANDRLQ
ncbi:hypothetical protein BKG85_12020 [Mycobacteroides chelonae]|nr:hypothetical protein BKG85_12020 [Mycobacteroides chelonae]